MNGIEPDFLRQIEQLRLGQPVLGVARGSGLELECAREHSLDRGAIDRHWQVRWFRALGGHARKITSPPRGQMPPRITSIWRAIASLIGSGTANVDANAARGSLGAVRPADWR